MIQARLGGATVGDGLEVCVMGAINVSPESFYAGSVAVGDERILAVAAGMVEAGAGLIDIGAMSTAPYLDTAVSAHEEAGRLGRVVRLLAGQLGVPVSADTSRRESARAALDAGAQVINDVSGLRGDPGLAELVAGAGAGLILMASPTRAMASPDDGRAARAEPALDPQRGDPAPPPAGMAGDEPEEVVSRMLAESLDRARAAGIDPCVVAVDPGIGFFRAHGMPWHEWDCRVLAALPSLRVLGRPICVGVSRKSFIGALTGERDPADRLPGSIAAAAAAVLGGAHVVRTHDVAETVQAVRVAAAIRGARVPLSSSPHPPGPLSPG
jgi:dihydropteroate synthase